jgi:hypothetical protein
VPPPYDAGPAPTASTNGGTYTRRCRDQKHVSELGHRKLPPGVVPAAVCLKTFGPSAVTGSGTFPVRNGQTTGTLVAGPLSNDGFSCPSGQLLFLDAVSYSNTVVTDQFGNFINATPDPISATVHIQIP